MHGDFAWINDRDQVQFMSHSIAVAYDADTGTLLKHGPPEAVHKWATVAREAAKLFDFDISIIESSEWDLEELDKILGITGYVGVFAKKQLMGEGVTA